MIEVHPFGVFVPKNPEYVVLGSFPTKLSEDSDWFYSNGRNQFWRILEKVYKTELKTINQKQALFSKLHIAITDIIFSCERKNNSNLDVNLYNITFNTEVINNLINEYMIKKIYFTGKYVEKIFNKMLIENNKQIELIYLPSPSPRYAVLSLSEKAAIYAEVLPRLE